VALSKTTARTHGSGVIADKHLDLSKSAYWAFFD